MRKSGRGPGLLRGAGADHIEVVEIATGEVALFWDTQPTPDRAARARPARRPRGARRRRLHRQVAPLADGMNELRRRMLAGEELLGTFLDLGSALAAEITAGAGFDWLVVDLEHGAGRARGDARAAAGAARARDRARAARGQRGDRLGARPRRRGRARPARAGHPRRRQRGRRHPLRAARAASTRARARAPSGATPRYAERADEERVAMVQIETRGALDAAGEIAALPGVDALFVGPYDLGVALGVTPGAATPEVQEAAGAVARRRARRRQGRGGLPRRPRARAALPRARLHAHQRGLHQRAAGAARPTPSAGHCGHDRSARPHRAARRDRGGRRGVADRRRRRERAGRGRRADRRRAGGDAPQPRSSASGSRPTSDREREEAAREHFDRTGRWPDDE